MKAKDAAPDRELQKAARERFATASRLEAEYARSLRQLTRHIDNMVKGMAHKGVVRNHIDLVKALEQYAIAIEPWAESVAEKILLRIAGKDEAAWIRLGKTMGKSLRRELQDAPTGYILRSFLDEQVRLIKSLPLEAAKRVHELALEALVDSTRAKEIAAKILETGKVTQSRATLIARTEVARVASGLTLARSAHVGVTHYIWRTSGDHDVRESHKKMNGQIIPVDTAPEVEPGHRYHAGQFPNCRCYPEPIIVDD